MKLTTRMAAALLALGGLTAAQAHNLWLLPSSTVLSKSEWVTVDAAVANDLFYFNHRPLRLDALAVTAPDGSALPVEKAFTGNLRSVFDIKPSALGTYRVAIANSGLTAIYKDANGQPKRWRGTPEKFEAEVPKDAQDLQVSQSLTRIETFITVGKPSTPAPIGQGLELVPVTHPNDLAKGEAATFAMHIDGQPAAGLEVTLVRGGTRYRDNPEPLKLRTDAQGRFTVTWPEAGMYWLDVDADDEKTTFAAAKKRRMAYVGTLEVLP
ncbi:MAG: DUF4198 domain-containing protein [Comamonadaceae bacterium]|nr:DUF4198 domain-containing protein [Comamonadaceae bacterium]